MFHSMNDALKWAGLLLGVLLILAGAIGLWVRSVLPAPQGVPVVLQQGLFTPPAQPLAADDRFLYRSATELAAMIRSGQATSTEIVRACIARIQQHNHRYNALIWLREEEALADAARADAAIARGDTALGALHGVPITIKEQFWVKGSPSTLNARRFGFVAPEDGALVQSLKRAGAILLGTTNVPFMLSDYQTHGEVYPTASNPYDTTRTPGGSSGGGAAALAAGFSAAELGSDMGGSIRVPSAFCGLWALKPTYGALNQTHGGWPDTTRVQRRLAMASPGPMARAPEDLALLWDALKVTPIDPRFQQPITRPEASTRTLKDLRFAWADEWAETNYTAQVGRDVREKMQELVQALGREGSAMANTVPPIHADLMRCFFATFATVHGEDGSWLLRKLMTRQLRALDPGTGIFDSYEQAMNDTSDANWLRITADRTRLTASWERFFQEHDFLVLPVTYGPAFIQCEQGAELQGDNGPVRYMGYVPFGAIINATGHPTLSVPMGLNAQGLPIGLQVVGPLHSEEELLHLAMLLKPLVNGFVPPPQP
ncbi:MAG TPA: amidase [Flavobacteriales bacterium]